LLLTSSVLPAGCEHIWVKVESAVKRPNAIPVGWKILLTLCGNTRVLLFMSLSAFFQEAEASEADIARAALPSLLLRITWRDSASTVAANKEPVLAWPHVDEHEMFLSKTRCGDSRGCHLSRCYSYGVSRRICACGGIVGNAHARGCRMESLPRYFARPAASEPLAHSTLALSFHPRSLRIFLDYCALSSLKLEYIHEATPRSCCICSPEISLRLISNHLWISSYLLPARVQT
jgi:hypothetical protein